MNYLVLILLTFGSQIFLIRSESCTITSTNTEGNCVPLSECPVIQNEIKLDRTKTPVVCSRALRTICCPPPLISRDNFDSEGLPETQNHLISSTNNHHFVHLNEACEQFQEKMIKNLSVASFILGEPANFQTIEFCNINSRDIGVAEEKEFPHVAYILGRKVARKKDRTIIIPEQQVVDTKCSGSLVSENYVLTTAVCVNNIHHSSAIIYFGVFNLTTEFESQSVHEVHKYNIETFKELSLLRLTRKMKINEYAVPACLSSTTNNKFVLSGWIGYRYECNPILKKWYLQSDEVQSCGKAILCVGSENIINYHETLLPGSPLHIYHPNNKCQYIIKGLFKRVHAEKYEFLSLQSYLPWMERIITSNSF